MEIGKALLKRLQEEDTIKNNSVKKFHRCHYIYFILDTEYNAVKIGVSKNAKDRLRSLQSANLHPLQILKTIKFRRTGSDEKEAQAAATMAGFKREKEIHTKFDNHLIRNEWFRHEDTLKEFIERL